MSLRVSDHALLRYFERVAGVDVEGLRLELARVLARGEGAASLLGQDHYVIRFPEAGFVVKGGVVVTVLEPKMGAASIGCPKGRASDDSLLAGEAR
jgi:hypothetical protein